MEKIYIASDHAAFKEKTLLKEYLSNRFEVIDLGTDSEESTHYPIYGKKIAHKVQQTQGLGIALCGSGIGISIACNRFKGVRAALCRDIEDAKMSKLHNNANIICFGGRRNSIEEIKAMTDTWLATNFEGGRHQQRVELLDE
jgi:ribose 5-phosphate isomerase B